MSRALRYLGPAVLGVSALWLVFAWESLPARWVTHWGLHGQPDGFTHKSVIGAGLPLLFGGMTWLLFDVIARSIERAPAVPTLARAFALPLRLCAAGMATAFAAMAVALPFGLLGPRGVTALMLGLTLGPLAAGLVRFARASADLRRAGQLAAGWRGAFYYDPADPRVLVPNLLGVGYTFNFGRPAARWLLALLLAPSLVLLVLVLR